MLAGTPLRSISCTAISAYFFTYRSWGVSSPAARHTTPSNKKRAMRILFIALRYEKILETNPIIKAWHDGKQGNLLPFPRIRIICNRKGVMPVQQIIDAHVQGRSMGRPDPLEKGSDIPTDIIGHPEIMSGCKPVNLKRSVLKQKIPIKTPGTWANPAYSPASSSEHSDNTG